MVTDYDQRAFEYLSTQVVDRATGKTIGKVIPKAKNHGFSRDGKWFLTSEGKTARVWEVETGRQIVCLTGHNAKVGEVAFAPGKRLVSGSADRSVRVWPAPR